ncbi:MAG: ATP:cob(I)alamin adenosyltransferase, partial [Gammaproteobacteria bacterium]|nr:ATP:cob(I)alamin adenosyltransferase [Gammaproteobacteria bacterium]
MGHRLSKIYTRTGDDGSTGLGSGDRVPKDSARVEAYGAVDETNSLLGVMLASNNLPQDVEDCLTRIQHQLFDLGGELSMPGTTIMTAASVDGLERTLDDFNADLPPLK